MKNLPASNLGPRVGDDCTHHFFLPNHKNSKPLFTRVRISKTQVRA